MSDATDTASRRCSLKRRLAAAFYDLVLVFGIVLLAATIPTMLFAGPVTEQVQPAFYEGKPLVKALFILYTIGAAFLFYGWFWTHGGQTLGLKTWRIRVQRIGGGRVSWQQAFIRFAIAFATMGVSLLSQLWDRDNLTWHDRFSGTEIVRLD